MSKIEDFFNSENGRKDEFEPANDELGFPCCACVHRDRQWQYCQGCRHYNT